MMKTTARKFLTCPLKTVCKRFLLAPIVVGIALFTMPAWSFLSSFMPFESPKRNPTHEFIKQFVSATSVPLDQVIASDPLIASFLVKGEHKIYSISQGQNEFLQDEVFQVFSLILESKTGHQVCLALTYDVNFFSHFGISSAQSSSLVEGCTRDNPGLKTLLLKKRFGSVEYGPRMPISFILSSSMSPVGSYTTQAGIYIFIDPLTHRVDLLNRILHEFYISHSAQFSLNQTNFIQLLDFLSVKLRGLKGWQQIEMQGDSIRAKGELSSDEELSQLVKINDEDYQNSREYKFNLKNVSLGLNPLIFEVGQSYIYESNVISEITKKHPEYFADRRSENHRLHDWVTNGPKDCKELYQNIRRSLESLPQYQSLLLEEANSSFDWQSFIDDIIHSQWYFLFTDPARQDLVTGTLFPPIALNFCSFLFAPIQGVGDVFYDAGLVGGSFGPDPRTKMGSLISGTNSDSPKPYKLNSGQLEQKQLILRVFRNHFDQRVD